MLNMCKQCVFHYVGESKLVFVMLLKRWPYITTTPQQHNLEIEN